MLRFNFFKNRKGQVAETMTWVIATIIIIVLLVSAIYVSSLLGKSKNLQVEGIENYEENNWAFEKTQFALSINDGNQELILSWVKGSGGNSNGN